MSRCRRHLLAGAGALALVVLLSACGSSTPSTASMTAEQIFQASKSAMSNVSSLEAKGNIVTGSKNTKIDLDLTPSTSGGTITVGSSVVSVIVDDKKNVYFEGNTAFWASVGVPSAIAPLFAGKWVTGLSAPDTQSFSKLLNLKELLGETFTGSSFTKEPLTTINGQSAIPLKSPSAGTGYIAADGPAYLLRVSSPNNGARGEVTFSGFNATKAPSVPTNAFNFKSLLGS